MTHTHPCRGLLLLLVVALLLCACGAETPDTSVTPATPEASALPADFPQLWPEDFPFGQDAAAEQLGLALDERTLQELRDDEDLIFISGLYADQLPAGALTLRDVPADHLTTAFRGDSLWYVETKFYARDYASTAEWLDAVLDWYAALKPLLSDQGYIEEAIGFPQLSADDFDLAARHIVRWTKDGLSDGLQAQLCLCGSFEESLYVSFMLGIHLSAPA